MTVSLLTCLVYNSSNPNDAVLSQSCTTWSTLLKQLRLQKNADFYLAGLKNPTQKSFQDSIQNIL